jgi:hypothetical protein
MKDVPAAKPYDMQSALHAIRGPQIQSALDDLMNSSSGPCVQLVMIMASVWNWKSSTHERREVCHLEQCGP